MTWIKAKRDSQCAECEADIREGEPIFYEAFKAYCESCGEEIQPQMQTKGIKVHA